MVLISRMGTLLAATSVISLVRAAFIPQQLLLSNRRGGFSSISLAASEQFDLDGLSFRQANQDDIDTLSAIESASYPADEAASRESLEYRQQNAAPYFRCAVQDENVIGYICSTRCAEFEHESMTTHDPTGSLLAIHSVVVKKEYRRQGIASHMMKKYADEMSTEIGIQKMVLIAKSNLLGFYVNCGFKVTRPSDIVHGEDSWYDLEMDFQQDAIRSFLNPDESWFVKTEQFCKPFPVVKPHLEAHRIWVEDMRAKGFCITSGYRVDAEGKPGGGGMMFFAAKSYAQAEALVLQDPLVINQCVEWRLNGWIPEVGNVQMR
eukprot:scaffold34476_cov50-Attheya_sp.AAC.1